MRKRYAKAFEGGVLFGDSKSKNYGLLVQSEDNYGTLQLTHNSKSVFWPQ